MFDLDLISVAFAMRPMAALLHMVLLLAADLPAPLGQRDARLLTSAVSEVAVVAPGDSRVVPPVHAGEGVGGRAATPGTTGFAQVAPRRTASGVVEPGPADGAADPAPARGGARPQTSDPPLAPGETVYRQLFERMVIRGGKISSDSLHAAITLCAEEGAHDKAFLAEVLDQLDRHSAPAGSYSSVKRNLLVLLGRILTIHGAPRWRAALAKLNPEDPQQVVLLASDEKLLESAIQRITAQGRHAGRSDIDGFVQVLRAAHHPAGITFLRDVLRNPERNADGPADEPFQNDQQRVGQWSDNLGGTWGEAKFHSAVALAELGEAEGVDWLIRQARPNDFGTTYSLFQGMHVTDRNGNCRDSSRLALADLFGLPADADFPAVEDWWQGHRVDFVPRPAALQPFR